MAEIIDDTMSQQPAGLEPFKNKLDNLVRKASEDGTWPKGEYDGCAAINWGPTYDILFTYNPEGYDDRMVEVHLFPGSNPRTLYDEAKEAAEKEDPWGQVSGWVDSPSGYPSRNDYDTVRMSGMEKKNPRYVRWVQQSEGDKGGYFVRLETSSEAPEGYLKEYADGLWKIIHELGYYNPQDE